jgi:serine/threonine-protein kinase
VRETYAPSAAFDSISDRVSNVAEMTEPVRVVGRYALYGEIAAGGMATVHFGRLLGPVGFSRTVAIKRLHPQFAKDPEFVSMFLDEARLAARIRHPNVVPTLDVVATQGELFLVMDYVQGESLSRLIRASRDRGERIPIRMASAIIGGALHGLHAAHEAKNERGEPLHIVHRDISPQNVLVGTDGVARVLDFGVAKAAGRVQTTREGQLKGKLAYMAPEQINGQVTRQTDVYAAAIVLWETLTGQRLFAGENEGQILSKVMGELVQPPSVVAPELPVGVDEVVLRGLAREPAHRYATAREFAIALERCAGIASSTEVGEWVEAIAHPALTKRAEKIAEIESSSANVQASVDLTSVNGGDVPSQPSVVQRARALADPPVSQASQLSSISVSGEIARTPRASQRRIVLLVSAMATLAMIVVAAFFIKSTRTTAAPATLTSDKPQDAVKAPAQPTAEAPSTTAEPIPPPSASVQVAAATTTTTGPTRVRHTQSTAVAQPPPTVSAPPVVKNCDPPYTLDSQGHKMWKRECM